MNTNLKKVLAVFAVFALVATGAASAATYQLNAEADAHPDTYFQESHLTVESHNQSTMDWLEYEGDNGKTKTVKAHVNGTESGAKVSYLATHLEDEDLLQYPRQSGEENNTISWADASAWTSTTGVSVTEDDGATAAGVDSLKIATDGSLSSGSSANVAYTEQSITSDAQKRYLQLVLDVDDLESSATVEFQVRDGNGDYVTAEINASRSATASDVIASETAQGVVYQEQLGKLTVEGSGDGSLDAVEEVRIVTKNGDATVHVTGLNVQKKSMWDFGDERVPDTSTDTSDDYTSQAVYDHEGGRIEASSLQGFASVFEDATVHNLRYLDVRYAMEDSPETVNATFTEADNYPNFPYVLDLSYSRTIPSAYDLTHGDLTLKTEQSFLANRYLNLRYAEGVGDKSASEVDSSAWIDLSGALGEKGKTLTADSTVQSDTTYIVEVDAKLLEDQYDALQQSGSSGGFWGGSGSGSGGNPFTSLYNWIAGGIAGLLSMVGIKAKAGS